VGCDKSCAFGKLGAAYRCTDELGDVACVNGGQGVVRFALSKQRLHGEAWYAAASDFRIHLGLNQRPWLADLSDSDKHSIGIGGKYELSGRAFNAPRKGDSHASSLM
jgi:hypothetical protein